MESKKPIIQSNDLVRSFPQIDNDMSLSVVQKRILFFLITKIREDHNHPKGKNWVRVDIGDMTRDVLPSRGGKESKDAWDSLTEFRDKKYALLIRYKDQEGTLMERATNWILEIERPVIASGYLNVHIPDLIVQHVRDQDSLFTLLDMPTARKLKSYSQLKLWELLTSHASKGKWEVSIKVLKRYLEINEDSYKRPSDFRKHVLKKSIEAINDKTRLNVSFDFIKDGSKPVDVLFTIKQTKQIKASNYSTGLQRDLKAKGILHLSTYESEGITEDNWLKALETDLEENKLVSEARKFSTKEKANKEIIQSKVTQDERIKQNKAWFEAHKDEFEGVNVVGEFTVSFMNGEEFAYARDNFREMVAKKMK